LKHINIRSLFIGLTVFCLSFAFSTTNIFAIPVLLDQQCRTFVDQQGSMSITNRTDLLQQTFKPTQDRLTKVNVLLNGDGDGVISLWIVQNTDNGSYYINSDGPLPEPNGKTMMSFNFNNVVMVPGSSYTILPATNDLTKLEWYYQENCYANGDGFMGTVKKTFDFAFQTYGYSLETPLTGTPVIINLGTPTPSPTATVTNSPTVTVKATASPTNTIGPTATVAKATSSLTPILNNDSDIPFPSLEYVLNDLNKEENMGATIELNEKSDFVLFGKGVPGAKILISIGEKSFETTVDQNGYWYLKFPMSDIPSGAYLVKGQTQIDGAGSENVDLINVNVKNTTPEVVAKQLTSGFSTYYPYAIAVLVVSIGLVLLGMYLDGKKKKRKIGDIKSVSTETENEGAKTPVVTTEESESKTTAENKEEPIKDTPEADKEEK
jgi:hypothetical protein